MRPFRDAAGADGGTSVQLIRGFLRVPVSVFCVVFLIDFLCSIIGPTSCGEGEKSARAEIRDARVRR